MGPTGSGKTTFINRASGSDFPVENGLESCTTQVQTAKPFFMDGRLVTLVDTPGFDDTTRSDTDVLTAIAAYLSNTYEQGAKLAGIIYMHRISDLRMSGTSKRNFRIFRELCGETTLRNVLVVTNMWGNVDPKIGEERERELGENDKLFRPVLEKGGRLLRHDNTEASARAILHHLVDNQAAALAIQHEIVDENRDLVHTSAGVELVRTLKEQAQRQAEEIKNLRAEMEVATRAKDEAHNELQEEVERKRGDIERIQRDVERMATDFVAEKARLEGRIAQMEADNQRYVESLRELQDQVDDARKKVETMRVRESEHPVAQRGGDGCKARLLEEQVAGDWAEAQKRGAETEQAESTEAEQESAITVLATKLEPEAKTKAEGEEQSRQFAEDIVFLVDFATKTFLPRSLETRMKAVMVYAARTARESTITSHKLISTYLSG